VEAPAQPELHRGGEAQAQQLVGREARNLQVVKKDRRNKGGQTNQGGNEADACPQRQSVPTSAFATVGPAKLTVWPESQAAAAGQAMGSSIELISTGSVSSAAATNRRRQRAASARPVSTKSAAGGDTMG
jgi:hypothetical protein